MNESLKVRRDGNVLRWKCELCKTDNQCPIMTPAADGLIPTIIVRCRNVDCERSNGWWIKGGKDG